LWLQKGDDTLGYIPVDGFMVNSRTRQLVLLNTATTDANFRGFPRRSVDVVGKGSQAVVSRSDDKSSLLRVDRLPRRSMAPFTFIDDDDSIVLSRQRHAMLVACSGDDVPGTVHAAAGAADLVQNCYGRVHLFSCCCRDGTRHSHARQQVLSFASEW